MKKKTAITIDELSMFIATKANFIDRFYQSFLEVYKTRFNYLQKNFKKKPFLSIGILKMSFGKKLVLQFCKTVRTAFQTPGKHQALLMQIYNKLKVGELKKMNLRFTGVFGGRV